MLHLLPEEHKAKVVREYRMRILIVLCLGLATTFLASAIFLVPSYLISFGTYSEALSSKRKLDDLIAAKQADAAADDVREISNTLSALQMHPSKRAPTKILERIVRDRPAGVAIESYIYTPGSDSEATADVSGKASTRAALSAYVDALKKDRVFSGVSIPLSSFAKERDISFSLKISINTADESWAFSAPEALITEPGGSAAVSTSSRASTPALNTETDE